MSKYLTMIEQDDLFALQTVLGIVFIFFSLGLGMVLGAAMSNGHWSDICKQANIEINSK